jgi:predicted RNA-binding Zn-ribbon protein involved in translation (DUF1610 family)
VRLEEFAANRSCTLDIADQRIECECVNCGERISRSRGTRRLLGEFAECTDKRLTRWPKRSYSTWARTVLAHVAQHLYD